MCKSDQDLYSDLSKDQLLAIARSLSRRIEIADTVLYERYLDYNVAFSEARMKLVREILNGRDIPTLEEVGIFDVGTVRRLVNGMEEDDEVRD